MADVSNLVGVPSAGEPVQSGAPRNPAVAPQEEIPRYLKHTIKRKGAPTGVPTETGKRKKTKKASALKQVVADVALPISNQELSTPIIDVDVATDAPLSGVVPSDLHNEALTSDFHRDFHETSSPALHDNNVPPPSSSGGGDILPLPSPGFGTIWERAAIPDEVRRFLDPPRRFNDFAPLEDADLADLRKLEVESLRASSLVLHYSQLRLDALKLAADLSSSLEARRKVEEELRVSVEACVKANADFTKASSSLTQANADLEKARTDLQKAQSDLKISQDALSLSQADLLKAQGDLKTSQDALSLSQADLVKTQGDLNLSVSNLTSLRGDYDLLLQEKSSVDEKLQQASTKIEELEVDLTTSVKDAFSSCLKQIHFLNPNVTLNLDGVHHNSYVHNNQFIRAEPEVSVSAFANEEDDEEEEEEEESRQPGMQD